MTSQRLLPALILLFSLTGVLAETQAKTDWPTYLHDHSRSGISATKLKLPLKLKWSHKMVSAPKPAWPEPAERDYWRSKNHEPIMIFDKANHLITADGKVYFGSSSNDSVTCLDAKSGATIWKFYTEGPIRFAPEYSEGKVYFGSDDGYVY